MKERERERRGKGERERFPVFRSIRFFTFVFSIDYTDINVVGGSC